MRSWLYAMPVAIALLLVSASGAAQQVGVSGSIERLSSSTPAEKQEYATRAVEEIQAAVRKMERIAESSPECVTERLPLVRSLLEVSTSANENMGRWLAANNPTRADSEFRKIAIALSETRTLLAEAERCSSGTVQIGDETLIDVNYDGAVVDGDETLDLDEFEFDVGMDPPQSSPYM